VDAIGALATFLVPIVLGVALVRSLGLRRRDDPFGYIGWVYLAGLVGTGIYLTVWLLLGLPLRRSAAIPLLLIAVGAWFLAGRRRRDGDADHAADDGTDAVHCPFGFMALVAALLVFVVLSVLHGNRLAVTGTDEGEIWAYKAKMLYAADGFGPEFDQLAAEVYRPDDFWEPVTDWLDEALQNLPPEAGKLLPALDRNWKRHVDYPLLNPLVQLWSFTCCGRILHWQNRLLIQGCALALLFALAGALLRVCHPVIAGGLLVAVYSLEASQLTVTTAYADGMVALGLLVGVDALQRWRTQRRLGWLVLSTLGLTMMVWSKHEGLLYGFALALGCLVTRPGLPRRFFAWLLLPAAVIAFTWVSNAVYGFTNDIASEPWTGRFERLGPILGFFWESVYLVPPWADTKAGLHGNFLYALFLLLLLTGPMLALRRDRRAITVALLTIMAGHLLVYVQSPHKLEWHLLSSAPRLAWQALPVVALWLGITSRNLLANDDAREGAATAAVG